jgi:hypothetical protein
LPTRQVNAKDDAGKRIELQSETALSAMFAVSNWRMYRCLVELSNKFAQSLYSSSRR